MTDDAKMWWTRAGDYRKLAEKARTTKSRETLVRLAHACEDVATRRERLTEYLTDPRTGSPKAG